MENNMSIEEIDRQVVDVLKTCYDPEIPVNIYDLGLIYQIRVNPDRTIIITMTLTSPTCPAVQTLPLDVKQKVENIPGVTEANVELVWDPPWHSDRMSEDARLELGLY